MVKLSLKDCKHFVGEVVFLFGKQNGEKAGTCVYTSSELKFLIGLGELLLPLSCSLATDVVIFIKYQFLPLSF